jgi:hypothetical protein
VDGTPDAGDLTLAQIEADPALRTRDDSGIAALAIGTVAWAIALGIALMLGYTGQVIMVCALGTALGVPGMVLASARRARLRRSDTGTA